MDLESFLIVLTNVNFRMITIFYLLQVLEALRDNSDPHAECFVVDFEKGNIFIYILIWTGLSKNVSIKQF